MAAAPSQSQQDQEIPVTEILSEWVSTVKPSALTPELRTKLVEVILDFIGVTLGATKYSPSTPSIYQAITTLAGTPSSGSGGPCTVFTKGSGGFTPQYAVLLNATLGHSLDFDDTYAPGTLHAGVTAVPTAFTAAELVGLDKVPLDRFLLSIAVAYEITCRVGRELGFAAYSQGMHNTSTAGIFGAVAAIAVVKQLDQRTVEMAFGLAGSMASGSMQYLENGSWNKRLHPGFACHDAFVAVALAEAGVLGATKIFEGKFGFLHAYSPGTDKDMKRLVHGLGQEWCWLESGAKPYPACRMTHGIIEAAGQIRQQESLKTEADIEEVTLSLGQQTWLVVGQPTKNKIHPENIVDAQFSAYYQSSMALLKGSNLANRAYDDDVLTSPEIRALASKTHVIRDPSIQSFGSKIRVKLAPAKGGKVIEREMPFPLGEKEHPFTIDKVKEKFTALVDGVVGSEKAGEILRSVDKLGANDGSGSLKELMKLLA